MNCRGNGINSWSIKNSYLESIKPTLTMKGTVLANLFLEIMPMKDLDIVAPMGFALMKYLIMVKPKLMLQCFRIGLCERHLLNFLGGVKVRIVISTNMMLCLLREEI
uniref:PolyP/ATP NAD kinase n=1 Tax=Rhizophora mucronata TaxID=61149 RepID=A0A2P2L4X0_RHIMU